MVSMVSKTDPKGAKNTDNGNSIGIFDEPVCIYYNEVIAQIVDFNGQLKRSGGETGIRSGESWIRIIHRTIL
jgi:hypothetical protein